MKPNKVRILALDLEGTLISDAFSRFPRPGLYRFLQWCKEHFERVAIFTCVSEEHVRDITQELIAEGTVPAWFRDIEYVDWEGDYKDLGFVADATLEEILLVDDKRVFILPDQKQQWLQIPSYLPPYADDEMKPSETIGTAEMKSDRTIVLMLRAEDEGRRITGDALRRYPPDHPRYDSVLAHVGPLEPGQTVFVKPWPQKD